MRRGISNAWGREAHFPLWEQSRKNLPDLTDLPTLAMLYKTWVLLFRGGGFKSRVRFMRELALLRIFVATGVR